MSAHAATSHDTHGTHEKSKVGYYVGVALRIAFDVGFTLCALCFFALCGTVKFFFTWTMTFAFEGFTKVQPYAKALNLHGIGDAFLDNLWSWATLAFPIAICMAMVATFLGFALFHKTRLGAGTTVVGGVALLWLLLCWSVQLFGVAAIVVVPVTVLVIAVVVLGVKLVAFLWNLAVDDAH